MAPPTVFVQIEIERGRKSRAPRLLLRVSCVHLRSACSSGLVAARVLTVLVLVRDPDAGCSRVWMFSKQQICYWIGGSAYNSDSQKIEKGW